MARKIRKQQAIRKADPNTIRVDKRNNRDDAALVAETMLRPTFQAACTTRMFSNVNDAASIELSALMAELGTQIQTVSAGNLERAEAMLVSQAHTLDAIFGNMARRAAVNAGEYINACQTYLRLALKAQAQCRATLETLALLKNPTPVAFVRQANIGHAVQVNNTVGGSRAGENGIEQNKQLEAQHGEWLDSGTSSTSITVDSRLAAVGELDGTKNARG